ncbi:hypothetical protein [Rhodococcus sp. 1R11]|uniref:hypothetical protein n=1 Tax=Rhodococcus sp. 1R11 TaxID=2559614 RepID=UPI00142FFE4D|nr:hypothetical protein [Rhodococcus sp. 1R11]
MTAPAEAFRTKWIWIPEIGEEFAPADPSRNLPDRYHVGIVSVGRPGSRWNRKTPYPTV